MYGDRYINGKWMKESDANQLFDVVTFMEELADQKDSELQRVGLRVCAQALEPLLERMQHIETRAAGNEKTASHGHDAPSPRAAISNQKRGSR